MARAAKVSAPFLEAVITAAAVEATAATLEVAAVAEWVARVEVTSVPLLALAATELDADTTTVLVDTAAPTIIGLADEWLVVVVESDEDVLLTCVVCVLDVPAAPKVEDVEVEAVLLPVEVEATMTEI